MRERGYQAGALLLSLLLHLALFWPGEKEAFAEEEMQEAKAVRVHENLLVKRNCSRHAFNDELIKAVAHLDNRLIARSCPHDQFGDH